MAKVTNSVETLLKMSIAWVGRTNVTHDRQTDRRQTDGRRHIAITFAKNNKRKLNYKEKLMSLRN